VGLVVTLRLLFDNGGLLREHTIVLDFGCRRFLVKIRSRPSNNRQQLVLVPIAANSDGMVDEDRNSVLVTPWRSKAINVCEAYHIPVGKVLAFT
jgi:hypothetical protein